MSKSNHTNQADLALGRAYQIKQEGFQIEARIITDAAR
jgi:hypothetical protein